SVDGSVGGFIQDEGGHVAFGASTDGRNGVRTFNGNGATRQCGSNVQYRVRCVGGSTTQSDCQVTGCAAGSSSLQSTYTDRATSIRERTGVRSNRNGRHSLGVVKGDSADGQAGSGSHWGTGEDQARTCGNSHVACTDVASEGFGDF